MDNGKILKKFGNNLQKARKAKGKEWTQTKLAIEAGLEPQHYSKLERGLHEPGIITVLMVARALGCRPGDLLNDL